MKGVIHPFILHNDDLCDARDRRLAPGQVGALAGWGVFSTIRVFDGVLFAFERHFARMQHDARLLRVPFPAGPDVMLSRLEKLIRANQAWNATLRVVVIRNQGGIWQGPGLERPFDLIALTAPVNEWGQSVKLGVVPHGRHAASRFAGAKMLSWCHNLVLYEEAHERGLDEVILLNERGEVSECTSANIFAEYGDEVWTPPLDSGCLPGVTRDILLHELHPEGVRVLEKPMTLADLEAADEVFITSTTRNLLPVAEIEGLRVNRKPGARLKLDAALNAYIENYVAARRTPQMARG